MRLLHLNSMYLFYRICIHSADLNHADTYSREFATHTHSKSTSAMPCVNDRKFLGMLEFTKSGESVLYGMR